jgi:hypothetical protein
MAMSAQQAADELYPPNQTVSDPDGETGEAQTDPYGYDEAQNKAFVQGAAWQANQEREKVLKAIEVLTKQYKTNPGGGEYMLNFSQREIESAILGAFEIAAGDPMQYLVDDLQEMHAIIASTSDLGELDRRAVLFHQAAIAIEQLREKK